MKLSNFKVDYHRNGIAGLGFHVTTFTMEDGGKAQKMLAVDFGEEADRAAGGVTVAVFDLDLLVNGEIRFQHNSWRGDRFNKRIREAIAEIESQEETP